MGIIRELDANLVASSSPQVINHSLYNNHLFEIDELLRLAKRMPERLVRHNSGQLPVTTEFHRARELYPTDLSSIESIREIEEANAFVQLMRVERDPAYGELVKRCAEQISDLIKQKVYNPCGWIFISSPNSITPYHRDQESNFLLQLRGSKIIHAWNNDDKAVISEKENEEFFGTKGRDAVSYQSNYENSAHEIKLTPGSGVYLPFTSPHWVENQEQVSISFSITYFSEEDLRKKTIYRLNGKLRNLGLKPSPIDHSPMIDRIKWSLFSAYLKLRFGEIY